MRLKNNFVQVENNPAVIDKVNAVAAAFGWTVKNVQITYSEYTGSTGTASWTMEFRPALAPAVPGETVKYADITYQRDMDDPRYPEWVRLEREYNESLQNNRRLSAQEYRDMEQMEMAAFEKGNANAAFSTVAKCISLASPLIILIFLILMAYDGNLGVGLICVAVMVAMVLSFLLLFYLFTRMNPKAVSGYPPMAIEKERQKELEKNAAYQALLQKERSLAQKERDAILACARAL